MKVTKHVCDIKGCDNTVPEDSGFVDKKVQVIFHTEQTEGRRSNPYLSMQKLDLCNAHKDLLLCGNYVHAKGAQGNNRFYFQKELQNDE